MTSIKNPSILAAMAGVTDGSFAAKCLFEGGAGKVTIGGVPIGKSMIESSRELIIRGRKEFVTDAGEELAFFKKQLTYFNSLSRIILNLRLANASDARKFANDFYGTFSELPIIEINAHCRQQEVMTSGGGQRLLERLSELEQIIKVFNSKDFQISLKFRGLAINPDFFVTKLNKWPLNYLHIDSYRHGIDGTDLELITYYSTHIDIPIIGNNSVKDYKTASAIISAGATFFSIARAALSNQKIFSELLKDF
ncbi:MAG: hypothetical protein EAX86_13155 [Candidatus Heimdallarchaeota archaeon]|nr:hypothetical protein [Candidatus Heimdallarchaeota archaeon]